MKETRYYSNGKLLITGEYVVLDGALSLAIPTVYGQSLAVSKRNDQKLLWRSLNHEGETWYKNGFNINNGEIKSIKQDEISKRLISILHEAKQLNSGFLEYDSGFTVETKLDFPQDWGLGSSSTLINNLAQWANIDAFELLEHTFGGSGYDIACAQNKSPITYQLIKNTTSNKRFVSPANFNPNFSDYLYFVHLNKKQDSREGIKQYNANKRNIKLEISEISTLTAEIINCNNLVSFNKLIAVHEKIIGSIIKETPIKDRLFSDFEGSIKSLGAWGGDFILVSCEDNPTGYFKNKGYNTIIPFKKMIL